MIEFLVRLREMASPAAVGCAGLAAVAAYLLVQHPSDRLIGRSAHRVLASSSRELLSPGPDPQALRDGVLRAQDDLSGLTA